jgi:hypothetical protein
VLKHLENSDKVDELLPSAKVRNNALMDMKSESSYSHLEKSEEADSHGIDLLKPRDYFTYHHV